MIHVQFAHTDIEVSAMIIAFLQSFQEMITALFRLMFQILIVKATDLIIDVSRMILMLFQVQIDLQRLLRLIVHHQKPALVFKQIPVSRIE